MTETHPTDAQLNDMSGTADAEQEVLFIPTGESPYYTSFYKMLYRLLKVSRRAGDLRVFKDGDLTFGVRAGKWFNGDALIEKAELTEQSLTNNQTNYIYYTAAGALTVNTTGFPVPSVTPHIPLAAITTSAGDYDGRDASDGGDITDCRAAALFTVQGSAAGNIDALDWQESVADEVDFTAAEPGSPTQGDRYLNTGTGNSSGTGQSVTANYVYEWNGASWTEIVPTEAAACLVEDRDMLIGYNGSAWVDIGTFALLNEAQTFFSATDISAAEAETLTDGSNADGLHVHGTSGLADDAVTKDKINADVAGSGLEQHTDGTLRIAAAAAGDGLQGGAGAALAFDASDVAGSGLKDDGSENLELDVHGLASAEISITQDQIAFSDESAAGDPTKKEAVADLIGKIAGDGIIQDGTDKKLDVNVDDSTLEISGDVVRAKDGGMTIAKLAAAVQDLMPNLNLTGQNDGDGTGTMTIQARDAANNNLAERFRVRAWIADAQWSEPDAQTDFSVTTGEQLRELEANADYEVISDANGTVVMNIDTAADKTVYVMAEIDGRICTGSVAITGN